MNVQDELASLYKSLCDQEAVFRACGDAETAEKTTQGLSAPFLVKTNSEYEHSKPKVVIVGQETWGWGWNDDGCSTYQDFLDRKTLDAVLNLYDGWLQKPNMTPFFRYSDRIQRGAFGNDGVSLGQVLWLNLFKFNHEPNACRMIDSPHRAAALKLQANVFQEEITLLKPDAVVFFTGPYYDEIIRHFFPASEFEPVSDFSTRQFARVRSSELPDLSFRTYHPAYLNRTTKLAELIMDRLVSIILAARSRVS